MTLPSVTQTHHSVVFWEMCFCNCDYLLYRYTVKWVADIQLWSFMFLSVPKGSRVTPGLKTMFNVLSHLKMLRLIIANKDEST